jgi:hypothetical protein
LANVLPANRYIYGVEPRGFEPLTSAVQMRPDESASVRLQPENAANPYILMDDIGSLVRPIPLAAAWVGVGLVSRSDYSPKVGRAIDAGVASNRGEHANLEQLGACRTVISCRSSFGAGLIRDRNRGRTPMIVTVLGSICLLARKPRSDSQPIFRQPLLGVGPS